MGKKDVLAGLSHTTVPELEEKSVKEIWVINNTKPRGQIKLSIPKQGGRGEQVLDVHNSWIPQNLTEQTTKRLVLNAPEFRKQVSKRNLILLTEKSARKAMQSTEAQVELDRILAVQNEDQASPEAIAEDAKAAVADAGGDCQAFVLDLLGREFNKELKEADFLSILDDREEELTEADLKYLAAKSGMSKIKKWAAKQLNA